MNNQRSPWTSFLILIFSFFWLTNLKAQTISTDNMTDPDYPEAWQLIDSLLNQGLYQSALERVESLQNRAREDQKQAQIIKTLIFESSLQSQLSETPYLNAVKKLQEELASSSGTQKALLEFMIAELYQQYLNENYWKMRKRTDLQDSQEEEDWRNLTAGQLQRRIFTLYENALQETALKTTPAGEFKALWANPNVQNTLRPTLFDLLAHKAINYFKDSRSYLSEPGYDFTQSASSYFADIEEFVQLDLGSINPASAMKLKALLILQELAQFRLNEDDQAALIDLDLNRLEFLYINTPLENKERLYRAALDRLADRYQFTKGSSYIHLKIAELIYRQGEAYVPRESPDSLRWKLKEAEDLCKKIIKKSPKTPGALQAQFLIDKINAKSLKVISEHVTLPKKAILAKISYKNIKAAYFKIIPLSLEKERALNKDYYAPILEDLLKEKAIRQWAVKLPSEGDHHNNSIETIIKALDYGRYALVFSDHSNFKKEHSQYYTFAVSKLGYFNRIDENGRSEFILMDRASGQALQGVQATFYDYQYRSRNSPNLQEIGQAKSDKDGRLFSLGEQRSFIAKFELGKDVLFMSESFYNGSGYQENQAYERTTFFLDRAIYRPGQTIYFKGIITRHSQEESTVDIVPNQTVQVTFRDVNYQEIGKQTFQTNAYGTFNGSFEAPVNGLSGYLTIESDQGGSIGFSVEEYKRPKFQVTLDDLAGDYTVNDRVTVKGQAKAFAGNVIDGAKVSYRVTRSDLQPFPWIRTFTRPYYGYQQNIEIANGVTRTDAEGNFNINFQAIPNVEIPKENAPRFRYKVEVDVVDITGETRSNSQTIIIGYTGMVAKMEFPNEIDRASQTARIPVVIENHNGSPLTALGTVNIYQVNSPDRVYKKRYWTAPNQQIISKKAFSAAFPDYAYQGENSSKNWTIEEKATWSKAFNTEKSKVLTIELAALNVGVYDLELKTKDSDDNEILFRKRFMVYDSENKSIPKHLSFWSKLQTPSAEPGQTAQLIFATQPDLELPIFFEKERKGKIITSEWLTIKNWKTIAYQIEEADRGNIQLQYGFTKNNRARTATESILIPFTNKKLNFTYRTFRDKLRPGQAEEWIIKISGSQKEAVSAEMVATLYDASLDQFANNQWKLNLYSSFYRSRFPLRSRLFDSRSESTPSQYINYNFFGPGLRAYPDLRLAASYERYGRMVAMDQASNYSQTEAMPRSFAAESASRVRAAAAPPPPPPAEESNELFSVVEKSQDSLPGETAQEKNSSVPAPIQIRKDLDETVFFFPDLYTDEEGNVLLKFKMKEALTKWKFLGLAHTKDLKVGLTEQEVITQKELMIIPNAPRFVREGDAFEFTAKVSNLTSNMLQGRATIEFLDPMNQNKVNDLLGITNAEIDFTAAAGQSARLAWDLKIPFNQLNGLTYRVMAQSEQFSDGEENSMPVLTNRTLVTATLPMTVRAKKTATFDFTAFQQSKQSATATPHLFQLSFTSNPAWMAVKSLPYLMEYPYECSEQLFNRFYANSLSAHILNAHPSIKGIFERWEGTDALKSDLEKQQALKNILIEETPWAKDAQDEATQRAQIALLFDLNRLADEQQVAIDKLAARQSSNGGFAWFGGGRNNTYITNYLIAGFGHLHSLGALDFRSDGQISEIIFSAIGYADTEFSEVYQRLLKNAEEEKIKLEDNHLTPGIVQYLYARSFFQKIPIPATEALDFYKKQASKYWNKTTLQQQAQLGLIGDRLEIENLSTTILASLKERAIQSAELGMYWKYNTGYFWYQAPIETHAIMIEFFDQMGETTLVDELKIWLLKNKQTNAWQTTKATAEAIWALLQTTQGNSLLLQDQLVDVQFPNWKKKDYASKLELSQAKAEAGTGQFEVNWKGNEIQAELGKIKLKNKNDIVSWGAAYWQYFEDLDQVTSFKETPLKLEKKLYKQINTDAGSQLQAITKNTPLQAGDLVKVRIELSVDRDMEFVHLKDMRASGFEPINVLSGYRWQDGLGYYESTKDLATHFFMDYLPKGNYVFEYPLRAQLNGDFSNGISVIQSMYAPEFTSHSKGQRINIVKE